jgi:hypothetical protein
LLTDDEKTVTFSLHFTPAPALYKKKEKATGRPHDKNGLLLRVRKIPV